MNRPTEGRRRAVGQRRVRWSVPLDVFAIPLGLAALGGAWSAFTSVSVAVGPVVETLFAASTVLSAGFTVSYFAQLLITRRLFEDLRHPRQGPFAAYIPVIGILLTVHYEEFAPNAMRSLMLIFVLALALVAAALLRRESRHPSALGQQALIVA